MAMWEKAFFTWFEAIGEFGRELTFKPLGVKWANFWERQSTVV